MPDDLEDVRGPRRGAGDGERAGSPASPDGTALGPPGAAPPTTGPEQAAASSTIFVPDDAPRGGATKFVADEGPRPNDGTLLSFPADDRRRFAGAGASPSADVASIRGGGTLLSFPPDDGRPSGETTTEVPAGALPRRAVRVAASLALVAVLAALVALAYSTLHASVRKAPRDADAEGEPPTRAAAGAGIEARARCEQRVDGRGVATATVTCDVSNHGPVWARARITAWLDGPGGARRVGAGKALLAPEERATLRFEGPAFAGAGDACDCRVEGLR